MYGITVGYRVGPREFDHLDEAIRWATANDFAILTEVAYRDGKEVSTYTAEIMDD